MPYPFLHPEKCFNCGKTITRADWKEGRCSNCGEDCQYLDEKRNTDEADEKDEERLKMT